LEFLKEKILSNGQAIDEHILKVDSFLNHQVEPLLMQKIGKEFALHFLKEKITKVATIESSGIAPALFTALELNVPLVILKKQPSKILNNDFCQTEVKSFTKGNTYNLTVSKKYINSNDHVLFIDDFLAYGEAALGALRLFEKLSAKPCGIGIVIEKSFQPGRTKLNELNIPIYSLAKIKKMTKGNIIFND